VENKKHITPAVQSTGSNKSLQYAALSIVAILVFASGWAFGSGKVSLDGVRTGTVASTSNIDFAGVKEVDALLRDNFDGTIDDQKVLDGLKSGVAKAAGDPYTEFFNAEDSKAFDEELNESF